MGGAWAAAYHASLDGASVGCRRRGQKLGHRPGVLTRSAMPPATMPSRCPGVGLRSRAVPAEHRVSRQAARAADTAEYSRIPLPSSNLSATSRPSRGYLRAISGYHLGARLPPSRQSCSRRHRPPRRRPPRGPRFALPPRRAPRGGRAPWPRGGVGRDEPSPPPCRGARRHAHRAHLHALVVARGPPRAAALLASWRCGAQCALYRKPMTATLQQARPQRQITHPLPLPHNPTWDTTT